MRNPMLIEKVTYENFLQFLECDEPVLLEDFFFAYVWKIKAKLLGSDLGLLRKDLHELFLRKAANDKLLGKTDFLELCKKAVWRTWFDAFEEFIEKEGKT